METIQYLVHNVFKIPDMLKYQTVHNTTVSNYSLQVVSIILADMLKFTKISVNSILKHNEYPPTCKKVIQHLKKELMFQNKPESNLTLA